MLHTARQNLALLLARFPLGLYFALAGLNKILGGVPTFVQGAKGKLPASMAEFESAYLHALPFVELAVGTFVVLGLVVRLNALLMALMLSSFLIAAQKSPYLARVYGEPGTPFDTNWILLGLALCLALLGSGDHVAHRIFRRRRRVVAGEPTTVKTIAGHPIG